MKKLKLKDGMIENLQMVITVLTQVQYDSEH